MIRQSAKVLTVFGLMGMMAIESAVLGATVAKKSKRQRRRTRLISRYSRLGLRVLGIQVQTRGKPQHGGVLYVGNHLSYLDVLIMSAQVPTAFVTSEEIREVPVLGKLCELGGCLFVERRSRARLSAEVGEITEALKHNINVTIFPEATSTNGEALLRFRRPLFQAAIHGKRPVVPFCLNYESIDGEKVTIHTRDIVCWYGDMGFVSHLWALAKCRDVQVRLDWLKPITQAEAESEPTAEDLAERSHHQVNQYFQPFLSLSLS